MDKPTFTGMPKFDGGPKDTGPLPTPAIKTFKSDVAETVQKDHISVVQMALAENRKREQSTFEDTAKSPISRINKAWIIGSAILVLLALAVVGYFYFRNRAPAPVTPVVVAQDIIFSESTKKIPLNGLSKKNLAATINAERDVQLPLGSILKLEVGSTTQISTSEFFGLLYTRIPAPLLRSFDKSFFLGMHAFSTNEPFLIIPISNYDTAYAGMLDWEKNIKDDVGALFIPDSLFQATSTSAWRDKVIENKDARTLIDAGGRTLFFYSFVDKGTLVFTTNSSTLKEVLIRLNKPKLIH